MSDNDITRQEYREEIRSTAETVIEETEEYHECSIYSDRFEDKLVDEINTTADWHQWVSYYGYALDVLSVADSDPEEWWIYVKEDEKNHMAIIREMARACFRQDLYEETMELLNERRESGDE